MRRSATPDSFRPARNRPPSSASCRPYRFFRKPRKLSQEEIHVAMSVADRSRGLGLRVTCPLGQRVTFDAGECQSRASWDTCVLRPWWSWVVLALGPFLVFASGNTRQGPFAERERVAHHQTTGLDCALWSEERASVLTLASRGIR